MSDIEKLQQKLLEKFDRFQLQKNLLHEPNERRQAVEAERASIDWFCGEDSMGREAALQGFEQEINE